MEEPDTTLTFVQELQELKRVLECQQHKGKRCYVSPINGKHQLCNTYKLSYWVKQIISILFFYFQCLQAKFMIVSQPSYLP